MFKKVLNTPLGVQVKGADAPHGVGVGPGPRDPGPRNPGIQDRDRSLSLKVGPGSPLKFKSGTPGSLPFFSESIFFFFQNTYLFLLIRFFLFLNNIQNEYQLLLTIFIILSIMKKTLIVMFLTDVSQIK